MIDSRFSRLQRASQAVLGTFHPESYSIGYVGNLQDVFQDHIKYPLEENSGEDIDSRFYNRLVLYHEVIHYQQFVSSNFGLEYARWLNIAMLHIEKGKPWRLPIFRDIDAWGDTDPESIDRFSSFLWLSTELEDSFYEKELSAPSVASLYSVPHTPPVYLFGQKPTFENVRKMAEATNLPISGMPYLRLNKGDGSERHSRINIASLMEGYAHLAEIHHILNAYPEIQKDPIKLLSVTFNYDPTYTTVCTLYFNIFGYNFNFWLNQLSAIIDIALMYSPGIIHDVGPMHSIAANGNKFQLWSNTFIEALTAGKKVPQMREWSAEESQRFQDDITDHMGIPRVSEMTEMGLELLKKYNFDNIRDAQSVLDQETPLIRRVMAHHYIGLNYRKKYGAGYGSLMYHTPTVQDFMDQSAELATFYDLESGKPYNFDPRKIFQSTISRIVWSALMSDTTDCPLKFGVPYKCQNTGKEADLICKFGRYDDKRNPIFDDRFFGSECWVDVFDRFAQVQHSKKESLSSKMTFQRLINAWRNK